LVADLVGVEHQPAGLEFAVADDEVLGGAQRAERHGDHLVDHDGLLVVAGGREDPQLADELGESADRVHDGLGAGGLGHRAFEADACSSPAPAAVSATCSWTILQASAAPSTPALAIRALPAPATLYVALAWRSTTPSPAAAASNPIGTRVTHGAGRGRRGERGRGPRRSPGCGRR
jgi:hypothetical protein